MKCPHLQTFYTCLQCLGWTFGCGIDTGGLEISIFFIQVRQSLMHTNVSINIHCRGQQLFLIMSETFSYIYVHIYKSRLTFKVNLLKQRNNLQVGVYQKSSPHWLWLLRRCLSLDELFRINDSLVITTMRQLGLFCRNSHPLLLPTKQDREIRKLSIILAFSHKRQFFGSFARTILSTRRFLFTTGELIAPSASVAHSCLRLIYALSFD